MATELQPVFVALRKLLRKHRGAWTVQEDSDTCYFLAGVPGPAALKAWRGSMKWTTMQLASVRIRKTYVSYHLMGVYGMPQLLDGASKELMARMQGKSCFNFKTVDADLFRELDDLTARSIAGFKKTGFVCEPKKASNS